MESKYTFSCQVNNHYVNYSVVAGSQEKAKELIKKYYEIDSEHIILVSVEEVTQ